MRALSSVINSATVARLWPGGDLSNIPRIITDYRGHQRSQRDACRLRHRTLSRNWRNTTPWFTFPIKQRGRSIYRSGSRSHVYDVCPLDRVTRNTGSFTRVTSSSFRWTRDAWRVTRNAWWVADFKEADDKCTRGEHSELLTDDGVWRQSDSEWLPVERIKQRYGPGEKLEA